MLEVINRILILVLQLISCTYVAHYLINKKLIFSKKNILIFLLILIIFYIVDCLNVGMYKPLIVYVIVIIGFKFIFDITINESIIVNFISSILHLISEIILPATIIIFKIPESFIKKYLQMTILSGLLIFGCIYLLLALFGKWIIKLKDILNKEKVSFALYSAIALALVILFWKNLSNWKEVNSKNFLANIFIIAVFISIIILLFKDKYEIYKVNNKFDDLFEQTQSIKTLLQRYRKYNHENKNQLIVIRENSKSNKKVKDYIDSILKENAGHEDKWINELSYISDPGISGFLSVKINHMIDNNVNVSLTISPKVKNFDFMKLNTNEYKELCKAIGVYMDNAYEASKETKKKEVTIEMIMDGTKLVIIISNSFNGKIDLEKIGEEGYTTKGDDHGIGLSLVRDIIKSNKNFDQKTEIIKDYFYQYLYIEK